MALVVETGAIIPGANSYVSVEDADAYFADRDNSSWASATTPQKTAALIKATQYIDTKYSRRFKGQRTAPAQTLFWPRQFVLQYEEDQYAGFALSPVYVQCNTLPQQLKDAVCEGAVRSLSGELSPDLDRGGMVSSVTVGSITQSFSPGAPSHTVYQVIDQLMMTLVRASGSLTLERS